MDYSDIKRVEETTDVKLVQERLQDREWRLLALAPGKRENGEAYNLYALGWTPFEEEGVTYI